MNVTIGLGMILLGHPRKGEDMHPFLRPSLASAVLSRNDPRISCHRHADHYDERLKAHYSGEAISLSLVAGLVLMAPQDRHSPSAHIKSVPSGV